MNEIKVYKSPRKALWLFARLMVFVIVLFLMITVGKDKVPAFISWPVFALFVFGALVPLFNLLDRRPQLIINETGIFDRSSYKDFINWNTIDHAYWNTIYGQRFVCLIIKDEYKQLIKGKSFFKRISMAVGMQEININLNELNEVDQEKLTALIINLSNAKPSDRNKLLSQTRPLAH